MDLGTIPRTLLILAVELGIVLCASQSVSQVKVEFEKITANDSSVTVSGASGTTVYKAPEISGLFPTDNLELSFPTVGLFIGISQYAEGAGVKSTPAHTISAAMMHEAFFEAALQSEWVMRAHRFNLPAVNIRRTHSKSVNAVTLSSNGTVIASGSEDGTIVIADADGAQTFFRLRIEAAVEDLAFSPDDRRLMAAGSDGSMLIWDLYIGSSDEPRIFKHPGELKSAIFSPDGSHILTTFIPSAGQLGKAVWIWPLEGSGEPIKIAPERSCITDPLAVFSPASDLVATASCKSVRLWPLTSTRASKSLPVQMPRSLSFSPDGSRILVADNLGVRFWLPDTGKVVPVSTAAKLAELSPDGSHIAIVSEDGSIEIWKSDPPRREMVLRYRMRQLNSLRFSSDNQHLLMRSVNNTFLQELGTDTVPYTLPKPLDSDEKWRGVRDLDSLKEDGLAADKAYVPITSVGYSRDSSLVAIGYRDGRVAVVPGIDSGWRCDLRDDRLTLMTDLQIPVDDPESKMLLAVLSHLDGVSGFRRLCSAPVLSGGQHVRQAGAGEHITRKRVVDAIADAVETARTMLHERRAVVLVIYISAHGLIGPDGAAYVLPADADAKNPSTWVSYSQVLEPVRQFIANLRPEEQQNAVGVVMFDTCQIYRDSGPPSEIHPPNPQRGLIIVESASPGQYAWHWTVASSVTKEHSQNAKSRPNSQHTSVGAAPTSEVDFRTRISVLPVSSQYALSQLMKKKENAPEQDAKIVMSEWVANVPPLAQELQARIAEAQQTGLLQTVRVIAEPDQADFSLFKVRAWK